MALVNIIIFIVVAIASILGDASVNGRVISPQVNTVKDQNGDIYDCVDFYEQPTFQHPLLRNHSFNPKMEPSYTPKRVDGKAKTTNTKDLFLGFRDGGCPFGTVPIRRVTKEQRDRDTRILRDLGNSSFIPNGVPVSSGLQWVIVQSKLSDPEPQFFGLGAKLSVLNPDVKEDAMYSSAQCMIMNGIDEYIEFGWTVSPEFRYTSDHRTHMYILTKTGDDSRCYNTDCPGFVIVRPDLPLDAVLSHYSSPKELVTLDMMVYHDPKSGNWWLTVGENRIGFWPGNIFSFLSKFGTYVECGGKAYSDGGGPDIGTGKIPADNLYYDAFVENFEIVNDKYQWVDAHDTETFVTSDKYRVDDWGVTKGSGYTFVYGGPRFP